jgi:hypothetical protein
VNAALEAALLDAYRLLHPDSYRKLRYHANRLTPTHLFLPSSHQTESILIHVPIDPCAQLPIIVSILERARNTSEMIEVVNARWISSHELLKACD